MWKIFYTTVWAAGFCLLGSGAAFSNSDIRALIDAGDYIEARSHAQNLHTAGGYALAAESLNGQILLGEVDDLNKQAKLALALAEQALALDPAHYNARLQQALADGFVTRTTGSIKAWRKKMPLKTLALIVAFNRDYPDDARGQALYGAWHLGVIRKAGLKRGGKMFGASLEEGKRLYRGAIARAPHDVLVRTNYIMSLLALDEIELHSSDKKTALADILLMSTNTDIDRKIQARAQEVSDNLDDRKRARKLAERFLDGK
jgi:hypothetical protein